MKQKTTIFVAWIFTTLTLNMFTLLFGIKNTSPYLMGKTEVNFEITNLFYPLTLIAFVSFISLPITILILELRKKI